jgi:hypothetical protein
MFHDCKACPIQQGKQVGKKAIESENNFLYIKLPLSMKVRIPHRLIYIAVFLLLAFLCYQAHQLTRHLVGAILCGGFGTMTFTITIPRSPCSLPILVILSGPVLTYGLAWLGMFLLRSPKYRLFAYALIFASFAHLRFIQTLTGRGDESILAEQWLGVTSRPVVALIAFLIGLPPVIAAFRAIANQGRWSIFIGSWLLPLPLLFVMLFANRFLFGENGNERLGVGVLGISWIVLVIDLIASCLLIAYGTRYFRPQVDA